MANTDKGIVIKLDQWDVGDANSNEKMFKMLLNTVPFSQNYQFGLMKLPGPLASLLGKDGDDVKAYIPIVAKTINPLQATISEQEINIWNRKHPYAGVKNYGDVVIQIYDIHFSIGDEIWSMSRLFKYWFEETSKQSRMHYPDYYLTDMYVNKYLVKYDVKEDDINTELLYAKPYEANLAELAAQGVVGEIGALATPDGADKLSKTGYNKSPVDDPRSIGTTTPGWGNNPVGDAFINDGYIWYMRNADVGVFAGFGAIMAIYTAISIIKEIGSYFPSSDDDGYFYEDGADLKELYKQQRAASDKWAKSDIPQFDDPIAMRKMLQDPEIRNVINSTFQKYKENPNLAESAGQAFQNMYDNASANIGKLKFNDVYSENLEAGQRIDNLPHMRNEYFKFGMHTDTKWKNGNAFNWMYDPSAQEIIKTMFKLATIPTHLADMMSFWYRLAQNITSVFVMKSTPLSSGWYSYNPPTGGMFSLAAGLALDTTKVVNDQSIHDVVNNLNTQRKHIRQFDTPTIGPSDISTSSMLRLKKILPWNLLSSGKGNKHLHPVSTIEMVQCFPKSIATDNMTFDGESAFSVFTVTMAMYEFNINSRLE